MGLFKKIKDGLKKTREAVVNQIDSMLKSFTKIDEELFEELEELLVMGDVGVNTATKITDELRKRVKKEGITNPDDVMGLLREITADMLRGGEELNISTKPSIILVIGVNGVGKTTTIGKLAKYLKNQGKSVLLAAADTFRAAAIEQLEVWADRAGCEVIKQKEGSDPAAVVYDAISAAKARKAEFLIVLDATTGQNAVNQAREFKNAAGITGIVLTKLDGTAKGGVVLSIKEELGVPVKFIGVGEQMDDLQPFDADDFAKALFTKV